MNPASSQENGHTLGLVPKSEARVMVARHRWLFVAEGVILVALGAVALAVPPAGTLALEFLLGWLFAIGGAAGLISTFVAGRHAPGFWLSLASAVLALVAGILLLGRPYIGAVSLTFVLTAFLLADGVFTILFGIEHRRRLSRRWVWLTANGVLDLVLAALILFALPASYAWALGIFLGVDLVFGGFALIATALSSGTAASGRSNS